MLATVRYQIGTYEGEVSVNVERDAEDEDVIAKAKRVLYARNRPPLGLCSESWEVVSRKEVR